MAAAFTGQEPGERGLSRAGRAVKDYRSQAVGRQQPPEQFSLAEKVPLADKLVERGGRMRAASGSAWRRLADSLSSNKDMAEEPFRRRFITALLREQAPGLNFIVLGRQFNYRPNMIL